MSKMEVDELEPSVKTEERKKKKKKKMKMEDREKNPETEDKEKERGKKKIDEEEVEVKIETLSENPDKISPLIGYFPSGYDPLKVGSQTPNLEDEDFDSQSSPHPRVRVRVFRNTERTNRLQLVVSPNGSEVDFIGTNYSGEAAAAQVCTYALGVLDKQTQVLKIVPIASNKIFRLEPRIRGSDLSQNEPSDVVKEELTEEQKADKLRDLTLRYATKKSRNKAKKLESLHPQENPRSQGDEDIKLEGKLKWEALESYGAYNARNIPPHDISATTPQMAYPLHKIIFKGEWNYLSDILQLSESGEEVSSVSYPSFIRNRVYKLENIKDEEEKKRVACIMSYISHLIKFKDKHSMDGVSSAKNHKFPSILSQKFSDMFAESELRRLSDEKRDLLISYVLVLSLFVDGFRSDPEDISRDLRMSVPAMRTYYEHLGCKLVRQGTISFATLPVPLQFPKLRAKRKR